MLSETVQKNQKLAEYLREIEAPTYQYSSALHYLVGSLREKEFKLFDKSNDSQEVLSQDNQSDDDDDDSQAELSEEEELD